jgi:hypothetical protein
MPRTFVIIMCLPVKLTTVCAGSSCQVLIVLPLLLLSIVRPCLDRSECS